MEIDEFAVRRRFLSALGGVTAVGGLGLISTAAAAASAADGLGAFATVADLRAGAAEAPPAVIVAGYTSPGDGGGGIFTLDSTAHTAPDDGGMIVVTAAGKRYRRLCSSVFPEAISQPFRTA